MKQYMVRRERDFRRLEEMSKDTMVSRDLRAMMLLIFGGLDNKEQISILSSVNDDYNFDKVANAMRIQFSSSFWQICVPEGLLGVWPTAKSRRWHPLQA